MQCAPHPHGCEDGPACCNTHPWGEPVGHVWPAFDGLKSCNHLVRTVHIIQLIAASVHLVLQVLCLIVPTRVRPKLIPVRDFGVPVRRRKVRLFIPGVAVELLFLHNTTIRAGELECLMGSKGKCKLFSRHLFDVLLLALLVFLILILVLIIVIWRRCRCCTGQAPPPSLHGQIKAS